MMMPRNGAQSHNIHRTPELNPALILTPRKNTWTNLGVEHRHGCSPHRTLLGSLNCVFHTNLGYPDVAICYYLCYIFVIWKSDKFLVILVKSEKIHLPSALLRGNTWDWLFSDSSWKTETVYHTYTKTVLPSTVKTVNVQASLSINGSYLKAPQSCLFDVVYETCKLLHTSEFVCLTRESEVSFLIGSKSDETKCCWMLWDGESTNLVPKCIWAKCTHTQWAQARSLDKQSSEVGYVPGTHFVPGLCKWQYWEVQIQLENADSS